MCAYPVTLLIGFVIEGKFKISELANCNPPHHNNNNIASTESERSNQESAAITKTISKSSAIELTEEEEEGPPVPPKPGERGLPLPPPHTSTVGYQKIVASTKRSIHLYNPIQSAAGRCASLPHQASLEDGYVDVNRNRSQTLPGGDYVELDYQRSRKGRKIAGDMVKARSMAAINARKVKGGDIDEDEEFEYSYPAMSPKLKSKIAMVNQQKPKPQKPQKPQKPKSQPKEKPKEKEKKMTKLPSMDQDGYVSTAEVHEINKEQQRGKLQKGASVDPDGYVDCIILEEPESEKVKYSKKKVKESEMPSQQSSIKKLWQKPGFMFRK